MACPYSTTTLVCALGATTEQGPQQPTLQSHKVLMTEIQLTLEQHGFGVPGPYAAENPCVTFNSPKTELLAAYC